MPRTVGIWSASAGAMTSANRTGVSSGTSSSRGVRMLSANLRRTSVRSALVLPAEAAARAVVARGRWSVASMVAMESSSMSGGGQAAAGQAEIDVVERRPVRREPDRHLVAPPQHRDEIEELVADEGIEADSRLVEEQDLRVGEQRPRQLQPPPLPPAVARHRSVDDLAETEGVDDLVEPGPGLRGLDAPQPGVDLEGAP